MPEPPNRRVTLVLCRAGGEVLGALEPVELASSWWAVVADVVAAVRERDGLDVTVLRLLAADRPPSENGAHLVELAEVDDGARLARARLGPVPRLPDGVLADHPLRASYARPGGPAVDLAWADDVLAARGTPRTGRPEQFRTWNLSAIWRLPTWDGFTWLKVVPRFFAHEGAMLDLVRQVSAAVPPLLGHAPGRVLLSEVPGEDLYRAPVDVLVEMVPLLVGVQAALADRAADIVATGAFDWRPASFDALARDVVERNAASLDSPTREALGDLLTDLPRRHAAVQACGIPNTLVHGDFHPGNVRGVARTAAAAPGGGPGGTGKLVLMDWGDSGLGHPLLDQAAFLEFVRPEDGARVREVWSAAWRSAVPGSDPDRAASLLAPLAAVRQAVIYQVFLDRIEPAERVYHVADPSMWLGKAAAAYRSGGPG